MANNQSSTPYNFKVVLLGEGCVGKTSLVVRYVDDTFNSKHLSTVQVNFRLTQNNKPGHDLAFLQASFLNKKLNIDGKRINLAIWDTAGQEKFHALGPIYYRASNGAVLVYDITAVNTFKKVKNWVRELRKMLGADICLIIAGNKTDLEKDRTVALEEAEA